MTSIIPMTLVIILLGLLLGGAYCVEEIAFSPLNYDDPRFQYGRWERTPSRAPTPGVWDREPTPSVYCPSPNRTERSTPLHQPSQVNFIHEPGYDHHQSSGYNYEIEWKITVNHRVVTTDTETNLVSKPSSYWQKIKEKATKALRRKIARNRRVRLADTTIMVSVNSRPQRKFTKTFEGTNIDWTDIENKISTWENLVQHGKELILYITINYIEDSYAPSSRTDKRGKSSVTNSMLEARDSQIDAEHFSGQPSVWRDVYKMLRCPGSCSLDSQYCWVDPVGKRHYKLRTHHIFNGAPQGMESSGFCSAVTLALAAPNSMWFLILVENCSSLANKIYRLSKVTPWKSLFCRDLALSPLSDSMIAHSLIT